MSKIRIEKFKQSGVSDDQVLAFDTTANSWIGTSNVNLTNVTSSNITATHTLLSVNASSTGTLTANIFVATEASVPLINIGSASVNSTIYTGTANNATYLNGQLSSYYANSTEPGTAYSNAVSYADGVAGDAYSNAIAYAASNSYVNTTFAPIADPTFTGTVTANNVSITGNLTVSGTTTYVNTTELNIGDNIIVLNADVSGSPSEDAGFTVNRGTSANVSFLWAESNGEFTTGSANLNINALSVSNVVATQTNLQVDPAGTAVAMSIVFGG